MMVPTALEVETKHQYVGEFRHRPYQLPGDRHWVAAFVGGNWAGLVDTACGLGTAGMITEFRDAETVTCSECQVHLVKAILDASED